MLKKSIHIAVLSFALWNSTALVMPSFAQTSNNADAQKKIKEILDRHKKSPKMMELENMKGWTCRHMEDGGVRMHVTDDASGTKKMNGVPSSVAGFNDDQTPLEKLPPCIFPLE